MNARVVVGVLAVGMLAGALGGCARAQGDDARKARFDAGAAVAPRRDLADPGANAGSTHQEGRTTMQAPLTLELIVSERVLSMKQRSKFQVGFAVVNNGTAAIDPQLANSTLTVSEQRAYAWDLAVQNGPRDADWTKLPPGGRVTMSWPLGKAVFERPGEYHLVLRLGALESTADVRVTR